MDTLLAFTLMFLAAYLIGSIPAAFIIVRLVTGEDITQHGSGNIGAMNVRRTTGSWWWFTLAMVCDGLKGLAPVLVAKMLAAQATMNWWTPVGSTTATYGDPAGLRWLLLPQLALAGAVLGHNYSCWMALRDKRFRRTGKGLATGGGALLAYDWRYFLVVVAVGLLTIAVTKYMMAGQVSAALSLPVAAVMLHTGDVVFATVMALVVYAAHHKRFVGMLRGREPRLYVNDRMGPRG